MAFWIGAVGVAVGSDTIPCDGSAGTEAGTAVFFALTVVFLAFAVVFLAFDASSRRIRGSVFNILRSLFFVAFRTVAGTFLVAAFAGVGDETVGGTLMFLSERRKEFPTSQGSKRFLPEIVLENVFPENLTVFFFDPPRVFDLVFFSDPPRVLYPS